MKTVNSSVPDRISGAISHAGIELIRKKTGKEAFGFTMPFINKSDGTKFGKTNGKAIWLDRKKTSPYEMYQFLSTQRMIRSLTI